MDDAKCRLDLLIWDAWRRVRRVIEADPAEMRRRLERGRKALARPLRAGCLAVRACDTRIDLNSVPIDPESALFASQNHGYYAAHEVTLDTDAVRALCQGVTIDPPGQTLDEVAAKLGVTKCGLLYSRYKKVFRTHYVEGLEGKCKGRPRPLLYTDRPLDPNAQRFAEPDPIWDWTVHLYASRVPDGLRQTIERVPHYQGRGPATLRADTDALHPEHPLVDRFRARPRVSLALPPPPPDPVWYKWRDGEYVGYDWRNPAAAAGFHRRERARAKRQARYRAGRVKPRPSQSRGSLEFKGWRWLYCPLPPLNLLTDVAS